MSEERDTSSPFDGFDLLPSEMEPVDSRLRRDGAAWQARVPETHRLDALALTLAATLEVPQAETVPPTPETAIPTLPDVSAVGVVPFRRRSRAQNLLSIVAMVAIVSLIAVLLLSVTHRGPAVAPQATTPIVMVTSTPTSSPTSMPFTITRVDLSVDPISIAGMSCGTFVTVTYTATFHLAPNGPGGTIQFQYTVNNGRATRSASITAAPSQTTATYSFSWSGNLPADHTEPQPGGVMVQRPSVVSSPLLGPSGRCG